jgi:hypothetical protein
VLVDSIESDPASKTERVGVPPGLDTAGPTSISVAGKGSGRRSIAWLGAGGLAAVAVAVWVLASGGPEPDGAVTTPANGVAEPARLPSGAGEPKGAEPKPEPAKAPDVLETALAAPSSEIAEVKAPDPPAAAPPRARAVTASPRRKAPVSRPAPEPSARPAPKAPPKKTAPPYQDGLVDEPPF